jgi:galactonate dehydratase
VTTINMKIATSSFQVLHVNAKTNWSFIEILTADGIRGVGECSLNGWEPLQRAYAVQYLPQVHRAEINGLGDIAALCKTYAHSAGGLVVQSIKSATEQALTDAWAKSRDVPAWKLFCDFSARERVEVYANVNRATQPRTPEGFVASARNAIAQGFRAVKIAPFDGVFPDSCHADLEKIEQGIACVRAVCDAARGQAKVFVDCHWRFDAPTAVRVLDALAESGIAWYECPISEANLDALLSLRKRANAKNIVLAGAEMLVEVEGFAPLFKRGVYDVVMPDIKYCGGMGPLLRIADAAQKAGVRVAPHNPTGPICNFASVHACSAHPALDLLEFQLGESDLFTECVNGAHPVTEIGTFAPLKNAGWGADIAPQVLAARPFQFVPPGLDERLG